MLSMNNVNGSDIMLAGAHSASSSLAGLILLSSTSKFQFSNSKFVGVTNLVQSTKSEIILKNLEFEGLTPFKGSRFLISAFRTKISIENVSLSDFDEFENTIEAIISTNFEDLYIQKLEVKGLLGQTGNIIKAK